MVQSTVSCIPGLRMAACQTDPQPIIYNSVLILHTEFCVKFLMYMQINLMRVRVHVNCAMQLACLGV